LTQLVPVIALAFGIFSFSLIHFKDMSTRALLAIQCLHEPFNRKAIFLKSRLKLFYSLVTRAGAQSSIPAAAEIKDFISDQVETKSEDKNIKAINECRGRES
jgi:hypothetical protein